MVQTVQVVLEGTPLPPLSWVAFLVPLAVP